MNFVKILTYALLKNIVAMNIWSYLNGILITYKEPAYITFSTFLSIFKEEQQKEKMPSKCSKSFKIY